MATNQLLLLLVLLLCLPHADSVGEGIINGDKAQNTSFRYMVSVQLDNKHKCGGFLITDTFVLTAAHCSSDNLTVVLGTHNIKPDKKLTRLNVKCKIEHPDYKKKTFANDIMLLQLSKKVQFSQNIKTAKIPDKDTPIAANSKCRVAGWGNTQTNGKAVDDLRTVAVTTINAKVCRKEWEQIKRNIPANTICAGGNTIYGACQGDSGGPLVCSGVVVGIVSFNYNKDCDYPNLPNVYTQISKFLPWIEENIKRKV